MNKIFNNFLNLCYRLVGAFLFISCAFITIIFIFSAITQKSTMIIGAIIFGIFTYLLWRNDTYNNQKKKLQNSTTSFFKDKKPNEHQQIYFKHDKENEKMNKILFKIILTIQQNLEQLRLFKLLYYYNILMIHTI